jgi:membrane fusion protein (multidrug efflux system)
MLFSRFCLAAFALAVASVLAGCGSDSNSKPAAPAPRPHLVELAAAAPGALAYAADRSGSLRALREVRITNQEAGEIVEVAAREGERVARGQPLVRYDERILRAQLDKAVASRRQAELDQRRNRQLMERGFVSKDAVSRTATALEIARAEERLLRERLGNMVIEAPFAGVVSQRLAEPGNVTPQHTHLLTVIDPSRLVTEVTVSELVLTDLRVGDPASVRIDALGDRLHPGRIVRIHPSVDPVTRTGRVEVALDPVPPGARPGQFSRVVLSSGARERLLVPLAALRRDAQGEFVFVYQDDGTVRRAAVASGLRMADKVEIRSGIEPGVRVVTKGFIGLDAGDKVKPVEGPGV